MKTAVALMSLTEDRDIVFQSVRARRFHEDPTCSALRAGHQIHHCLCGDPYCGCRADPPPVTRKLSIGQAAIENLTPCAECYPGFQELAAQLPSDDGFGHVPFEYDGVLICKRCFTERKSVRETVLWPCLSAQILCLTPRFPEESIS